jgi:integrase
MTTPFALPHTLELEPRPHPIFPPLNTPNHSWLRSELEGQDFTFHSLRHTCATLLLSKNVNLKIVQEMLGHATIRQTMDTYSHVLPGMGDVAATALEEALG